MEYLLTSATDPGSPGRKNLLVILLLLFIAIMFVFAIFGSRGVLRIVQAEEQKSDLVLQVVALQQQQEQLKETIERLRNDKTYWEQLARTRLGMVREGELIYYLPDDDNLKRREKVE